MSRLPNITPCVLRSICIGNSFQSQEPLLENASGTCWSGSWDWGHQYFSRLLFCFCILCLQGQSTSGCSSLVVYKQRCVPISSVGPHGWYFSFTLLWALRASFVERPCLIVAYMEVKSHAVPARVDYSQIEGAVSLLAWHFHILWGWGISVELSSGSQNSHEQVSMLRGC